MRLSYSTIVLPLFLPTISLAASSRVRGFAGAINKNRDRQLLGDVTVLELIDAASNQKVAVLTERAVIDVSALGVDPGNLNVRAVTEGDDVSSVRFGFIGEENFRTETHAPFTMCGDDGAGDYYKCQSLGVGTFSMSAVVLETSGGEPTGVTGTPLAITFEIVVSDELANNNDMCTSEWTDFIVVDHSKEADQGEIDCGAPNALVTGLHCADHYCDDIKLLCHQCDSCVYTESSSYWTEVFSEEDEPMYCGDDHFMTGLACDGHYCDHLMMQCTSNTGRTAGSNCEWSEWMSEEGSGTIEFSDRYVVGIECKGHFCDNKRFWICPAVETC